MEPVWFLLRAAKAGLRKGLGLQSVRLEMGGGEVLCSQWMGRSAVKERH